MAIDRVVSDVLPQQKKSIVEQLRQSRRRVAMAGDGINDAPALAAVDLGVAGGPAPTRLWKVRP